MIKTGEDPVTFLAREDERVVIVRITGTLSGAGVFDACHAQSEIRPDATLYNAIFDVRAWTGTWEDADLINHSEWIVRFWVSRGMLPAERPKVSLLGRRDADTELLAVQTTLIRAQGAVLHTDVDAAWRWVAGDRPVPEAVRAFLS